MIQKWLSSDSGRLTPHSRLSLTLDRSLESFRNHFWVTWDHSGVGPRESLLVRLGSLQLFSAALPMTSVFKGKQKGQTKRDRAKFPVFCRFSPIFAGFRFSWELQPLKTADFRRKPQILAETRLSHLVCPFNSALCVSVQLEGRPLLNTIVHTPQTSQEMRDPLPWNISKAQMGHQIGWLSTWQVLRVFKARHFGTSLLWYLFGCLFSSTQRDIRTDEFQNGKFPELWFT